MVSIIVPVYNVEQFLPKCIESITNQTYRDLEIILVDDGSLDRSGIICDEYSTKDERIKVYHKKNGGLSDARNFGIARASGEYLGFVDGDDWIEPEMYEVLVNTAVENNADIVYCGKFLEYPERTFVYQPLCKKYIDNIELCKALIHDEIGTGIWSKLYHKHIFTDIEFPNGHVYEDTAVMFKFLLKATCLVTVSKPLYHYRKGRQDSITQSRSMANLIDYWLAHKSRYEYFLADNRFNTDKEFVDKLRYFCAKAMARAFRWYYGNTEQEKENYASYMKEMHDFCIQNFPAFGLNNWPLHMRISIFLGRFDNKYAFALLYYLLQGYRELKRFTNGSLV